MSRTLNTAPLRVQATTLPSWAVYVSHSYDCHRGVTECTYRPGEILPDARFRYDRCVAHPAFCCGHGGSRAGQSAVARLHRGAERAAIRAQLRDVTRAANTARAGDVERFADGTAAADWDADVACRGYDVSDWLW